MSASRDLHRMHHVGYVVPSISSVVQDFAAALQAAWDGNIVHDPLQKVYVTFLKTGSADAQIELVEPAGPDSPVRAFLEKTGGLHHICYEVEDLDRAIANMRARGVMLARKPLPAVAFANRRIAWMLTRQRLLVELLEERMPAVEGKES